jgi:transcriptional regulator with XRE-family HTH domain
MTTNLALLIIETDGVEFYTDITTGKSGISQTGLATLCGVSRQAVSKLINSLSTGSAPESLKALQEHLEENTWRTKSGYFTEQDYPKELRIRMNVYWSFITRKPYNRGDEFGIDYAMGWNGLLGV